jgi:hypothetical protein
VRAVNVSMEKGQERLGGAATIGASDSTRPRAFAVFALRTLVVSSTVPADAGARRRSSPGTSRMSARVRAPARGTDQRPSRLRLVLARAPLNGTRVTEFSNPLGKVALNLTRARRRLRGSAMLMAERDRWECRIRAHRERARLSHTLTGRRRSRQSHRDRRRPRRQSHLSRREAGHTLNIIRVGIYGNPTE